MNGKIAYVFSTKMWKDDAPSGWYFVSLPKIISKEIRKNLGWQEEGWGRMKALARIDAVQWETAIWYDTKMGAYILPIKAEIRKKLRLAVNTEMEISIFI
ncbi:MAG: DUF1905 domain-containing protein [Maribacter sp.]|uniref:DUF1905 domain-containing protein n=1 Tax=Maribacter sp. TaxID=1897614 RepID=UPI0032978BBC